MILSWLQSTISETVLPRIINCATSWHLWDRLYEHFQSTTRAKKKHLHSELRSSSLENRLITAYLLHIQSLIDSLASIGDSISTSAHINLILDGFPNDYRTICTILNNLRDPLNLDNVTSMLLLRNLALKSLARRI